MRTIFNLLFIDETPLMRAVHYGNTDIAEFLIQNGANINAMNNDKVNFTHFQFMKIFFIWHVTTMEMK